MALTATTLSGAKAQNDVLVSLTSASGIAPKHLMLIDGEMLRVTDISLSPSIGVVPGYNGTPAGPHGVKAPVIFGPTTDFVSAGLVAPNVTYTQSFGADGAITGPTGAGTVPVNNTIIYLTKGSAGAYTLAAPAIDQQNTIIFISTTAAAHTITYTAGFYGNTTSSDVATFPATINGCFTIKAQNGTWAPVANCSSAGVTLG
jgi:hypothetical protein